MDFVYPLPPADLHRRYDPLFTGFRNGLSGTLIGLPLSSRSAFLKFILEYPGFLGEFIDPRHYHFLILEDHIHSETQLVQSLALKIRGLHFISIPERNELDSLIKVNDPFLLLASLRQILRQAPRDQKIVIVIYEAEKIFSESPEIANVLHQLWTINRQPPLSLIHYCFIGSPALLDQNFTLPPQFQIALTENIVPFPLLSSSEIDYTHQRLEHFTGHSVSDHTHNLAARLSAGHYVVYKTLVSMPESEMDQVQSVIPPSLQLILRNIYTGLSWVDKHNRNFPLPLLQHVDGNSEKVGSDEVPHLTAQEKLIFEFLINRPNQVISRNEIAQVMWGKMWDQKYSDWAIDRAISNLRRKLNHTRYSLMSIRNRGYKFSA